MPPPPETSAVFHAADARQLDATLRAAAVHPRAASRRAATLAAARLRDAAAAPLLHQALMDVDGAVRELGAFGLARQSGLPADQRREALLSAIAAAPGATSRGRLLEWIPGDTAHAALPSLERALDSVEPSVRAGACRALGRVLVAGGALGPEVLLHAAHLATQTDATERRECAELLAVLDVRPGRIAPTLPMLERLRLMIERDESSVRLAGLRAAAHYADTRLLDPVRAQLSGAREPSITAAALRALAAIGDPEPIAGWLGRELARAAQRPAALAGPALPLYRLALESLRPAADSPAVHQLIERSTPFLVSRDTDPPRVALGRALVRCGVAELRDLAQGWPTEVTDCGAAILPAAWGEIATARVLSRVAGSDDVRAARLATLARSSSPRARIGALGAARSLPPTHAAPLLSRALGDDNPAVAAEAAAAVAWLGVSLSGEGALRKALLALGNRVPRHPELASPWITAVRVLDLRDATASLQELGRHPAPGLHEPALELLGEWGATLPDGQRPVGDPLPAERMPDPGARFHVKLRTTAGTFEVALDTARAPVASMRLVQRVRGGFLDDRPVGPVLAGALLGLETGGSVLLRHEDAPVPVDAGSVLMLDHGRDTADGTLAVALSRRPAMDGRFTILGRVTRGMQVVQALHEWDRILEAQVRVESGPAPSPQSET